ncbi:hypothetical protein D3C86_1872950 [compost metagenome]
MPMYSGYMVKKQAITKKTLKTAKKMQVTEKFQPTMMTIAVSSVAVISLFVLAYLTASSSL